MPVGSGRITVCAWLHFSDNKLQQFMSDWSRRLNLKSLDLCIINQAYLPTVPILTELSRF